MHALTKQVIQGAIARSSLSFGSGDAVAVAQERESRNSQLIYCCHKSTKKKNKNKFYINKKITKISSKQN